MKKLLGIVVLGLLWCNSLYAITQQGFIDKHLSKRKLDQAEGVWITSGGNVYGYYKSGDQYHEISIHSNLFRSGELVGTYTKGSETLLYGNRLMEWITAWGNSKIVTMRSRVTINGNTQYQVFTYQGTQSKTYTAQRVWPTSIASHNAKFDKKKEPKIGKEKKKYNDKELLEISSGTGFIISEDGYFISNNHVVDICKEIKTKKSNQFYKANIIATDKVNDLAIGKIDIENSEYISLSSEGGVLGEDIIVSGFPLQGELSESVKITKGVVSSLSGPGNNYAIMQIDAAVQPGNSGGPILNRYAQLVGVTVAKADSLYFLEKAGALPENVNFGVKVETLKSFIRGNNIKLSKPKKDKSKTRSTSSSTNKVLSSSEISKLAADSTIHLQCWNTMAAAAKLFQNDKVKNLLVDIE